MSGMNALEIEYPKKTTEAEIQAMVWGFLRGKEQDARLQVKTRHHKLDIVVFYKRSPYCIVECKAWSRRYSKERFYQLSQNTKQIQKYRRYGLPVIVCGRVEAITDTVAKVLMELETYKKNNTQGA